jgi:nucleoside-diphosphate-sugar epimerase
MDMKCLVTGAAGFIGSHLCESLVQTGHSVVGLDSFVPYYPRAVKEANLFSVRANSAFRFEEIDLRNDPLDRVLEGIEVIFHLSAMAGLSRSWTEFGLYESCNINGTHRLLEAARRISTLKRFLYASTSSVYGRFGSGDEMLPLRPISPYGVTKLAAENLCEAYAEELALPLIVLRYFSVYGPRQRPDMGYHRFIQAMLNGQPLVVYGDGMQVRGNTYISDCVAATIRSMDALPGETYNVGGGEAASVWDIIKQLEQVIGRRAIVRKEASRPGDQRYTFADTSKITRHLGWKPKVSLAEGLAKQVTWQRGSVSRAA